MGFHSGFPSLVRAYDWHRAVVGANKSIHTGRAAVGNGNATVHRVLDLGFIRAQRGKAMSQIFFDKIGEVFPAGLERMVGYSDIEMKKIERLYGIIVSSELASFLRRAGRTDGGLIGDDPLIIYRNWTVRTHILFQVNFFNDLQEIGAFDY